MADAIKLRAILACVERAFDVPDDAAIDAPPADDNYLRWLSDAEFDTFLSHIPRRANEEGAVILRWAITYVKRS